MSTKDACQPPDVNHPLLREFSTINPYRTAANLLFQRLVWDLNPEAWHSRRRLRRWRDKFCGQKAVVMCNGPSLLKVDLESLSGVFCFGLNKINLLFTQTSFRPNVIVSVNGFVLQQNANFFNETDIPLFLDSRARRCGWVRSRPTVVFLHSGPPGFSRDCSVSVYQGHTVTYVALQLAFHMGFSEVALVGADHNFSVKGPANKVVTAVGSDENHFDRSYFADGVQWQLPDLAQSEMAYLRAREVYSAFGRKVVNATEGGFLEVFERKSLQAFLQDGPTDG